MNKKGFTLIELLAVIVILAIIALIATPIVLNIISDSRESSNKQSIESLVRAAELYHASNLMKEEFPKVISLPDKDNILNLENAENMEGYITISKRGEIEVNVKVNGEKYAKNYNNSKVYNTEKEEYIYEGNPDEWIVSINDSSRLLVYKPIVNSLGTKEIIDTYVWIPYYFYAETSECFLQDINMSKEETIDKIMDEFKIKYPGYESYIPSILKKEFNILINKLKQKFGNTITDETLIDYSIFENYIIELKDEIPVIYDYYMENDSINLNLSNNEIDITTIIPSKVNGKEIKSITNFSTQIDCDKLSHCKELYYGMASSIKNYYYNLIISEGIEEISGSHFSHQQVYSVKFPSTLKKIGPSVFRDNQLTKVSLPDSVLEIGVQAFMWNKIKELKLPNKLTTIQGNSFQGNQIEKVKIPSTVTSIEYQAFADNPIKEVVIPASVISIGQNAFGQNNAANQIEKVTIEGDKTRFNDVWTDIGFPAELMPTE